MTLFDERTVVLPAPAHRAPAGPPPWGRIVLLAALLVALMVTAFVTAEAVARADVQREFAQQQRSAMSFPDSQRIDVDIAGPVLLQKLLGRYERITVVARSIPLGEGSGDMTTTLEKLRPSNGRWKPDRAWGAISLSSAQATALLIPVEVRGAMRVGFRETELTWDAVFMSAEGPLAVTLGMAPSLAEGRLNATISSATVGDVTFSAQELADRIGPVAMSSIPLASVCVEGVLPHTIELRNAEVVGQRIDVNYDIDVATFDTPAGRETGSCP